jgi:nitronate monooxygenase
MEAEVVIRTRFTDQFALRHPIVCAPMALVTGGRLARAVSRAGGLGIVGGGYAGVLGGEPDLGEELALARGETFGVGFITWALARAPERLDEALAHGPACVFLSFGDPGPFAQTIRAHGARLICQAQNLRHIDEALDAGADVIVAQGAEAGGHGGRRSTLPFVPEAADHIARRSPGALLLAAGGIADGRGLAAALMLGADGVVVGTRFWASTEALTLLAATDLAKRATGDDTVRTTAIDSLRGVPWPPDYSFRVLHNALTRAWAHREDEARAAFGALETDYDQARARGDLETAAAVAGEAVGLIHDRLPAADIVEAMARQAGELLSARRVDCIDTSPTDAPRRAAGPRSPTTGR